MRKYFFVLSATRAYSGILLEKVFLSPLSLLLYAMVMAPFLRLYLLREEVAPLAAAAFVIGGCWFIIRAYVKEVLLNDERDLPVTLNLAQVFSSDIIRTLSREPKLTTYSLLKSAVTTRRGQFILSELGIARSDFLARFETEINKQIDVFGFIHKTLDLALEMKQNRVHAGVLLYYFFNHGGPFEKLLNEQDLSLDDLHRLIEWERFHHEWYREKHTWKPENIIKMFGSFGRGLVTGYTRDLDRYTDDLAEHILLDGERKVVIQRQELESAEHILERSTHQNVLVTGREGVGKRTFIRNLAYRIRRAEVDHHQAYTKILRLNVEMILASEHPERVMLNILTEAKKSGKYMFVIDNLATLLSGGNANVISVFSRFIKEANIGLISICDSVAYHSLVKRHSILGTMFETVSLNDATEDETMRVLMTHYFDLEEKDHMHITYRALKEVIDLSKRYIGGAGFPGKAVAVLEDAASAAMRRGDDYVTESDVREMVSLRAHMDVNAVGEDERQRLLSLGDALKKQVIGQDRAVDALVGTLKRARLDIHKADAPLGTFLFLGTTGVGKTQTAKVLAEEYFGSRDSMIRLDMNEFSTEDAVAQIVGAGDADGSSDGALARRVQDRPFSLILLDEIEKAHPKVLNVFLQILDEGQLTDGVGMQTDFRNTIIIATSNAGALFMYNLLKKQENASRDVVKKAVIDAIIQENTFAPEFINRFDEVVLYEPLSKRSAAKIALLLIDEVIEDLRKHKGITLRMEEGVIDRIVEQGYSEEFGAREMRRVVTHVIEDYVADYMLRTDVKRGDSITITASDVAHKASVG